MVWEYEKFKGDVAVYAFCPKCKFRHNPSEFLTNDDGEWASFIEYQYNYCPICGEYLFDDDAEERGYSVTWNQRDISELYEEEAKLLGIEGTKNE